MYKIHIFLLIFFFKWEETIDVRTSVSSYVVTVLFVSTDKTQLLILARSFCCCTLCVTQNADRPSTMHAWEETWHRVCRMYGVMYPFSSGERALSFLSVVECDCFHVFMTLCKLLYVSVPLWLIALYIALEGDVHVFCIIHVTRVCLVDLYLKVAIKY